MWKLKFEYKITLIYLLAGCTWIIFSDKLLLSLTGNQTLLTDLQTYKGWFFVVVTSVLLYLLLNKHLNKLREAEEKAKKSNELKTAFLQNISHEIRTPMNSIIGFSDLLKTPQISPEDSILYIDNIHQSSTQLLYIVDELLNISKIESGNMQVYENTFHLNNFLNDIKRAFLTVLKKELSFTMAKGLPDEDCMIISDVEKLRQVLLNLLTNANKYTNDGSIHLHYSLENNYLKFWINDTGVGIDSKAQSKVFEPFGKAHNNKEEYYEGLGLGLAICKGNIELLKGKIGFQSIPDIGSTFFFTIPYKKALQNLS